MKQHTERIIARIFFKVSFIGLLVLTNAPQLKAQVAQDTLKNLPELSLPLTNKKLVIAHCMTHIIRYQGRSFEDGCNPTYYPPTNNASSAIGGYTQVNVMSDRIYKDSTLDQAVEFEMRAALRCGIDGFQFYYPLNTNSWDNIIKAYFRVATLKNIDFKFTFCFSHPSGSTEDTKIAQYAARVNDIMATVGKNNSHWLRTPDGRLIVYMWYGEQLVTYPANLNGLPSQFYVARAYRKLGYAIGEKLAPVYLINDNISSTTLDRYLDYFPAVWMWTQAYANANLDATIAAKCADRGRAYTGSAFPDFYTSKVLQPGTWNILSVGSAVAAGKNNIERKYMTMGLSYTFRKQLEFAVNKKVPIINIITWNDYPEGHHLAPEVNHNYGFSVLLQYYKSLWKGEPSPYGDRDVAIAFFKKYKRNVVPNPYNVSAVNLGNTTSVNYEDSVEVVSILPSAAQLIVNGKTVNVPAGISSARFESQPGAVNVTVQRNGVTTKTFKSPEWITNVPFRTDRLTYTFDTEYFNFHNDIFGTKPPLYSLQYNLDSTGTPIPVTLVKFDVSRKNTIAQLQWQTVTEVNTDYFNVQRSIENAQSFTTVGKVAATGNSSSRKEYKLSDNITGIMAGRIYYRLQVIDKSGRVSYSDIKSIDISANTYFNISPNPAKETLYVRGNNLTEVRILNNNGSVVIDRKSINADNISINISALAAGMYIVISKDADNNMSTQQLVL